MIPSFVLLAGAWLLAGAPPATTAVPPAPAPSLRCTVTYADEPVVIDVRPTTDPYRVQAVPVGRRFAFRAVWMAEPAERAALDLTVLHVTKGGDVPLAQVKLVPPYPDASADAPSTSLGAGRYGFTGLHLVYEPDLGSELRFWCAWGNP